MNVREIPPAQLDLRLGRLRYLPEAQIRVMSQSLRQYGQLTPLLASEQDEQLQLVDGFLRQSAAVRLKMTGLRVEVLSLKAVQMKAQLYLRNRERGLSLLEECRLLEELTKVDKLSQVEIADLLLRHKSWVNRRLVLIASLSPKLLSEGALCELAGGSLSSLAKLQVRNQEEVWAVCQRHELKPHEVGGVVELYRRAPDEEVRAYVLSFPREALGMSRKRVEGGFDARLGKAGGELYKLLQILTQVGLRIQRRRFDGIEALGGLGRKVLLEAREGARRESVKALSVIEGLLTERGGENDQG
jgi:hypothetical protein